MIMIEVAKFIQKLCRIIKNGTYILKNVQFGNREIKLLVNEPLKKFFKKCSLQEIMCYFMVIKIDSGLF